MKYNVAYHVYYEYRNGSFDVFESAELQAAYEFFASLYQRPDIIRAKIYKPKGMRTTIRFFDKRSAPLN